MKQIVKLTGADYKEIFALSQYAFQYKLSHEELKKRKTEIEDYTILGWMENNELAAKIHIIPFECYMNSHVFKMGGIASVATWPEYRRQGMIKHLLYRSLLEMKKEGQTISFLAPFAFDFYRKFGWEFTFMNKHYEIPIESLRQNWSPKGYVRRIQPDIDLLHKIYTQYAQQYTGMLMRDYQWWNSRVLKDDLLIGAAFNEEGQEEGYIIFKVQDRILTVIEMVYITLNGRKLLLEFIANHDSMVHRVKLVVPENDSLPLLLREPRFEQKLMPYFMARIVDVNSFLASYPFEQSTSTFSITLDITDEFFSENSGTYELNVEQGKTSVSYYNNNDSSSDINCTIQQLTSLLLGFKRPIDLYNLGLIKGELEKIKRLDQLIPAQQTFLLDFF